MATFLRVSALCVTLSALSVFAGCSKKSDNWHIGKWAFDPEATKANLPADNKAAGVPDSVAHTYKIIERPDANTIVIKNKELATFIKSGKYLCIPTTGAVQFKMYFEPVN